MLRFGLFVFLMSVSLFCLSYVDADAQPCPGPCPPGVNCNIEVVYAYMIHDPEAQKTDNAWMGLGGFDLVQWRPQNKAWITTRRAEAETKKSSLLSPRGKRSVIRKFFLVESIKR